MSVDERDGDADAAFTADVAANDRDGDRLDREAVIAARGPAHVRARSAGRHRLRPDEEQAAIRRLASAVPVHPETLPMTSTAEAAIVADQLLEDLEAGTPGSGGADDDEGGRRPKQTIGGFLREVVTVAVIAIVIAMLVKTFLIRPYYIPSASMEDTLEVGDRLIVNLLVPELVPVGRGDVIVFTDPGGWLPGVAAPEKTPVQTVVDGALEAVGLKPSDANDSLIKRVIGLPGDRIVCCNEYGQLTVNDVALAEPYVALAGNTAASGIAFDVTVPEGHVWVMGDNRYNSEDSRFHQEDPSGGFVPMDNVVGRAILVNWPLDRFGVLGNYPEVFSQIPSRDPQATG